MTTYSHPGPGRRLDFNTMTSLDIDMLRRALHEVADPDKAEPMAAYTKGHFVYMGVTAGDRRTVSKALIRDVKHAQPDSLIALATELWDQPERELHYIAMDLLRAGAQNLRPSDLDAVAGFITKTPWWDTVDSLAAWTVGPMVTNYPELVRTMDRWIDGDDLWLARTAILHQLGFKDRTDAARLFSYAERRAADTDFFIRKAIGWALRQYARVDPDAVRLFVAEHADELSGLTKREALKHLS